MTDPRPRSPYSDELLDDIRNRLFWTRDRLSSEYRDVADIALQPSGQDEAFESPGVYGSQTYAEEINLEVLQDDSQMLVEIEDALARIDGRSELPFGMCEACRDERQKLCKTCPWIAEERLRYVPWARHCAPVQQRIEDEQP